MFTHGKRVVVSTPEKPQVEKTEPTKKETPITIPKKEVRKKRNNSIEPLEEKK